MSQEAHVSATISSETRAQLDRFTERLGLRESQVVEQALLLFMAAHRDLADEARIPARLVLDDADFDALATLVDTDAPPSPRLVELMRG